MKKSAIAFVLALSCAAMGQIVVEEDVTTDTVNLFTQVQQAQKSAGLAMMSSLLLPGAGHHYLDRAEPALIFLTLDAAAVFGYFFSDRYARKLNRDASAFASLYAGARGGAAADNRYWQMVGAYMGLSEYNRDIDLNRDSQRLYPEDLYWRWSDESVKDEYNDIRESSRRYKMASTFFLAALVLNRAVAFVEIRAATRYKGIRNQGSLSLRPELDASPSSLSFSLRASF